MLESQSLPILSTLNQERPKVAMILRHSFFGTLIPLLTFRPIFAKIHWIHLSDTITVAFLHGIIGSLLWGVFISLAFLIYLIIFKKSKKDGLSGYLTAMILCGFGGFIGGVLCAFPSLFITNPTTIKCLGWSVNPLLSGENLGARLSDSIFVTRMFFALPLSGTLTGFGVGLCLNFHIVQALRRLSSEVGLLPVPQKEMPTDTVGFYFALKKLSPVLTSWQTYVFVGFSFLFSPLIAEFLNASDVETLSILILNVLEGLLTKVVDSSGIKDRLVKG